MTSLIEIRPKCSKCGYLSEEVFKGSDYMREVKPAILRAGWQILVRGRRVRRLCPKCSGKEKVVTVP